MSRTLRAHLSTENLLHNLSVIRRRAPRAKLLAMVKANAYGHGIRSVSQRLAEKVDALGVASIDEALALRKIGIKTPIMLMEGVFTPDELVTAANENFKVVFHHDLPLHWLAEAPLPQPLHAWVKVDTGMGRLGFPIDKAGSILRELNASPKLAKPAGLISHFACADEPDHPMNATQRAAFRSIAGETQGPKSLCNSAGLLAFPDDHYDWVRPGLALYGASPLAGKTAAALDLKPVMTLQTQLIVVRQVQKGETLGYGACYACPENMTVGVAAVGYGDGYPRLANEGACVLVNGARCPVIGRVSMDMMTIDLRPCSDAQTGDAVLLWGDQLPIEELASATHRTPYDLLTGVAQRVPYTWTPIA